MSKSVNEVRLLGNVGQAPEVKESNGTLRTTVSIATNERVKRNGNWEDHTEWHRVVFFARTAEIARDYLRKGSKVYVEGKLRTFKVEDAGQARYFTNIVANELVLLDAHDSKPPDVPQEGF